MKKIILSLIGVILFNFSSKAICVRCVNDNGAESCWTSPTSCTKQADGSGGSHCGEPADPLCSCTELAWMPHNTGNGQFELVDLPITNLTSESADYKLFQSENNTLILYKISTGIYKTLGNISSDIEGKWYKFEFSNDLHTLKMTTQTVTQNENGEILLQTPSSTRNFDL